jgi:hypothetical protein
MGNETFKERQKESARREKQAEKAARLMERRNEKLRIGSDAPEKNPKANGSVSGPTPNSNMLIRHGTESKKQRPRAFFIRLRIDEALAVT